MISIKEIAQNVRAQHYSAQDVVFHYLSLIHENDVSINSVTNVLEKRAIESAKHIDGLISQGKDPGPLAGVPFGVKDLFDVQGEVTTAGSKVLSNMPSAQKDATVIQQLCAAGAIPIATLNMDEFAYGFVTDNVHYGKTHNPHDYSRFAGGSSGGSAASVGGGLLPFSLGSDTNGSIRVPASLCGLWGIRPTFGALSMQGVYPFAKSFDTIGPFCSSVEDLKLIYDILSPTKMNVDTPFFSGVRMAQLGGWFERDVDVDILQAIQAIMRQFRQDQKIELANIAEVRSASSVMTAAEGGEFHLPNLRKSPLSYDPATRDRLIAGSLIPASTYLKAKEIQNWFQSYMDSVFKTYDLLIAPSVGSEAPEIDHPVVKVNGIYQSARVNLGIYTQPLSMCHSPILSIPIHRKGKLPVGIQLIARPKQEQLLFEVGAVLERQNIAQTTIVQRKKIV